tara:strand:- start:127 stop:588 length:462 start_codon:yes stop_codon:yes gene_type:complete
MATDSNGNLVFGRYSAGVNNVGSYQVSGWPYMTGSTLNDTIEARIQFPMVAKSVTVMASGSGDGDPALAGVLRVHYASTSSTSVVVGKHYFSMATHGDSVTINAKCKEIYLSAAGGAAGFQLFAEMTHIPTSSMYELTGVGITSLGDRHPGGE